MENIGNDSKGRIMFLDCNKSVVTVHHVDSIDLSSCYGSSIKPKASNSQNIDADDYNKYLRRPCGAWFYDHICQKYGVTL